MTDNGLAKKLIFGIIHIGHVGVVLSQYTVGLVKDKKMSPELSPSDLAYQALEEKISRIVAATLGFKDEEVNRASNLKDLNADSLDMVELVMSLEEKFDVEIPDEDIEVIHTVADIVAYIASKAPTNA